MGRIVPKLLGIVNHFRYLSTKNMTGFRVYFPALMVYTCRMTLDREDPHDWISEIAGCDLDLTFNALFDVLKRDIGIANNLHPKKRRNFTFKLERNGEGATPIIRITRHTQDPVAEIRDEAVVEFNLCGNAVRLNCSHLNNGFTMIYPKWDDEESCCKLYINDKHMKVWEISRLALQPVIFG